MKKSILIILTAVIIMLSACAKTPKINYEFHTYENGLQAITKDIDYIDDYDSMKTVYNEVKVFSDEYNGQLDEFAKKLNSYTAEYFKKNAIVVATKAESSGSNKVYINDIQIADSGEITVDINTKKPSGDGTCDMKYWYFIIEIPKIENFTTAKII